MVSKTTFLPLLYNHLYCSNTAQYYIKYWIILPIKNIISLLYRLECVTFYCIVNTIDNAVYHFFNPPYTAIVFIE